MVVPKEAQKEILEKIEKEEEEGYYLIHNNYFLGKPLKSKIYAQHKILKLFKNGKGYFKGRHAHEKITFTGDNVGVIHTLLIHNTHKNINRLIEKINLYSTQDANALSKGEKAGFLQTKVTHNFFYELLIKPALFFCYAFFHKRGFYDGLKGCILCMLLSYYVFIERAKVFEKRMKGSPSK